MGPDPPNSWEGEFPLPLVGLLVTKEKLHRVKRQPMVKMVETSSKHIPII